MYMYNQCKVLKRFCINRSTGSTDRIWSCYTLSADKVCIFCMSCIFSYIQMVDYYNSKEFDRESYLTFFVIRKNSIYWDWDRFITLRTLLNWNLYCQYVKKHLKNAPNSYVIWKLREIYMWIIGLQNITNLIVNKIGEIWVLEVLHELVWLHPELVINWDDKLFFRKKIIDPSY